jgi:hypothetical protein
MEVNIYEVPFHIVGKMQKKMEYYFIVAILLILFSKYFSQNAKNPPPKESLNYFWVLKEIQRISKFHERIGKEHALLEGFIL